jgi:flagellar biosynthetic protein FliP
MRTFAALAIVLSLILVLRGLLELWLRARGGSLRGSLRVLETTRLAGGQYLHVIELAGKRLLVGAAQGSVRLLETLPSDSAEARASAGSELGSSVGAAGWLKGLRILHRASRCALVLAVLCLPQAARAAGDPLASGLVSALEGAGSPAHLHSTLQVLGVITLVSVAPSLLLMATCFTRILIVLAFLRQAMGVTQLPPNQVLVGLALFVTLFVMAPVGERIHAEALAPYMEEKIDSKTAAERAVAPVRDYISNFTRSEDLALFEELSGKPLPEGEALPLSTLLPAYLLSELRTAFQIGFVIFLPFLVVDLVIASMLISMGMIVLPPIVVSLPFKLMLFVLLDGWNLVIQSLVSGLA